MKRYPLHWGVYVACAVAGSAAVALLVVADITGVAVLGRWGLATALLAAVIATGIVADRCARKVCVAVETSTEASTAALHTDLEQLLETHTGRLVTAYGERDDDRTEEIAEAVCVAVLEVINRGDPPTPINPGD